MIATVQNPNECTETSETVEHSKFGEYEVSV